MAIGNHVISVSSDRMGAGDDELGALLMKGFINTIGKVDPLPQKIIFYNTGARLAIKPSPVFDALKELEAQGVEVLICGTCADYFGIKQNIGVGEISNMPTIYEALSVASKIISP